MNVVGINTSKSHQRTDDSNLNYIEGYQNEGEAKTSESELFDQFNWLRNAKMLDQKKLIRPTPQLKEQDGAHN